MMHFYVNTRAHKRMVAIFEITVWLAVFPAAVTAIETGCENCACCVDKVCRDITVGRATLITDLCTHGCIDGIGGIQCYNKCPDDCITCGHQSYHICASCAVGKFLNNTQRCVDCPERCVTCTSDTQCQECVNGKYGIDCTQNCSDNCKDRLCEQEHGTCLSCYPGFNGDSCNFCDNGFYKQDCSVECKSSVCLDNLCQRNTGTCVTCPDGRYGGFCNMACSLGCILQKCVLETGDCIHGCDSPYSGDKCCVNNANCEVCDNSTSCRKCGSGYYGASCDIVCPNICSQLCDMTGQCTDCPYGLYGRYCENQCSVTCEMNDQLQCNSSSGVCEIGCAESMSGQFCNESCSSNCVDRQCKQDGACVTGCVDGFVGRSCTNKQSGDNTGVLIGSAVGGACLIGLIIGGLVMCIRRFRKPKSPAGVETMEASTFKGDCKVEDNVMYEIPTEASNYENTNVYDTI